MYSKPSSVICNRGTGGEVVVVDPWYHSGVIMGSSAGLIHSSKENMRMKLKQMLYVEKDKTMILCRTNKQVKAAKELGFARASTVHQAKGLEYDNVIVIDTTIKNLEDLNIAYVALTRARDKLMVLTWASFEALLS